MIALALNPTHTTASITSEYYENKVIENTVGDPKKTAIEESYEVPKPIPKNKKTYTIGSQSNSKIQSGVACSCVIYAQSLGLGIKGYGLAKNYPTNSKVPAASGFVVTYESKSGHIAYYVLQGNILLLQESNYKRCTITSGRVLSPNSKVIKGYIN